MPIHIPANYIKQQVQLAIEEDVGDGDVTAMLVPAEEQVIAQVICREPAVLCGKDWFNSVFNYLDSSIKVEWFKSDSEVMKADEVICEVSGPARTILTGERAALNFLQTLSGTATITRKYARRIADTSTRILDTRKTIPCLRLAQKYAVECGGGVNHRLGLYDMILIKENHIIAAGSITAAVEKARQTAPAFEIEVEVENLEELQEALQCNVNRILLDNMDEATLKQAVAMTAGKTRLEASGNINITNLRQVAETGVDFISIGAITKHVRAIDFSLRFKN